MRLFGTLSGAIVVVAVTLAFQSQVTEARAPASYSGVVYLDTNGNGVQDSGETPVANLAFTMVNDEEQDITHTFTTAADGTFRLDNLLSEYRRYGWTLCPTGTWWITGALDSYYRPDVNGCRFPIMNPGENVTAIGVQDMAAQSTAPATLSATGFADHNRDGDQDAGETAFAVDTRLLLTGPTPNDTRYSIFDEATGVMQWRPVFAPATGYAWTVCVPRPTGLDPERYEITSVTPGGSPAENGCWNLTIAPGENKLVFGFYDRLQPEGTPTPTMTPTPAPTEVPLGMRMALDCDPSQAGVQSSCDVTLGLTTNVDVDVLLVNDSAGDQAMAAVGLRVQTDRTRLFPPPFPEAGTLSNPDVNPDFLTRGMQCFSPGPFNEGPYHQDGRSYVGCFSGTNTVPIPEGSTTRIATIHYVVVDGAAAGAVNLTIPEGDFADETLDDRACPGWPGYGHVLAACTGATITLVAAATATPSPTATLTVTATPAQSALVQSTSTPRPASANAAASSARVVNHMNPAVAGGVAPVVSTPRVGVLGASIRPPNAGDGGGASSGGGTWGAVAVLLGIAGCGAVVAAWRWGAAMRR